MALSERQKRFVQEYLIDLNATQAAIRAGYSGKTARSQGQRMLTHVDIQIAIQKRRGRLQERLEISQERVLEELAAVAFAKGTTYSQITASGRVYLTPTEKLTELEQKAVSGIKETQAGIEVKTYDKVKALELLGKHLGLFDGKGGADDKKPESNLLDSIRESAEEELKTDDLSEV